MPELPEVETIVRDLNLKIKRKKIKRVEVRLKKIIKSDYQEFVSILKNNSVKNVKRRGKLLIFELFKHNKFLLIHLMMTGQLIYREKGGIIAGGHGERRDLLHLPSKYSHVIFYFEGGGELFFNDIRQFGVVRLANDKTLSEYLSRFGVEPLLKEFTLTIFRKLLANKKINIKAFLLNQKFVVGIGNIYADEILFRSFVSPNRTVDSLSEKEIRKIFNSIKIILKKAIGMRGTTFNNYVDASGNKGGFVDKLKVYQKEGESCSRCKNSKIQKIKVAGRGTRYCEKCQK